MRTEMSCAGAALREIVIIPEMAANTLSVTAEDLVRLADAHRYGCRCATREVNCDWCYRRRKLDKALRNRGDGNEVEVTEAPGDPLVGASPKKSCG
jgi:hypothetical protein